MGWEVHLWLFYDFVIHTYGVGGWAWRGMLSGIVHMREYLDSIRRCFFCEKHS
jgi:hypothetical protein